MSFATRSYTGQNGRGRKQIAHNIKPKIIMRNSNLITALVAGAMVLATTNLKGQNAEQQFPAKNPLLVGQPGQYSKQAEPAGALSGAQNLKASTIIGLPVRNESGERLGKVQDLIVSMASHSVPFAIVEYGGALGVGATHVAVPLPDLKWSSESKQLILTTTKEQFESASTTPTGEWAGIASDDCLKNADRFYGQPSIISQSRYERQEATGIG
jgi:sporulation protein YlmC with PRC-barrel domain